MFSIIIFHLNLRRESVLPYPYQAFKTLIIAFLNNISVSAYNIDIISGPITGPILM